MATWVLGAIFFIVLAVVGTGLLHLRKQNKRNEKALQGRYGRILRLSLNAMLLFNSGITTAGSPT